MLIDDDPDDNFLHTKAIKKINLDVNVVAIDNGKEALGHLTNNSLPYPDLIFLDINMYAMSGWEFLELYDKLNKVHPHPILVMLSTSSHPADKLKAKQSGLVAEYVTKPLTELVLKIIIARYFTSL